MKIIKQHQHPKFKEAISSLLLPHRQDFYFYFLSHVDFYEIDPKSVMMPTAGATVINMRLAIIWCKDFMDSLSLDNARALILHELFHLIHHHLDRGKGYNQQVANIAMDMIINHLIVTNHSNDSRGRKMTEMMQGWVQLDKNYKGSLVFEHIYEWLQAQNQQRQEGNKHEMSPETCKLMDQAEAMNGQTVDIHELPDDIQGEIKKQIANECIQKAKMDAKKAGNMPGDIDDLLKILLKAPKKDNIKLLKRVISALKGKMKEPSYKRSNKRIPGLKGNKKIGEEINVILDTSGSMMGNFDKVLTEIYKDGLTVNIVECDTQVQKVIKTTKKSELNTLSIKGLGGTELNCGIKYIQDPKNGLSKYSTAVLTDGELYETLDFGNRGQWLILTTHNTDIKMINGNNVRIIKIDNEV